MHPNLLSQIEESSHEFPILGYTVIAAIKGIEVKHDALMQALTGLGFGQFTPPMREPGTTLRRALTKWLKSLLRSSASSLSTDEEEDEEKRTKRLIREIASRRRNTVTLALVTEDI